MKIKLKKALKWQPAEDFESGLSKTVRWYLANADWCKNIHDGSYKRLGLAE